MYSFISEFDVWLTLVGVLILLLCLLGIRHLFKDECMNEIDPHEEMLWRILDKGDKR